MNSQQPVWVESTKKELVEFMIKQGLVSPHCHDLMQMLQTSIQTSNSQTSTQKQFMMDVVIRFFMNLSIQHIGMLSVCLIEKFVTEQVKTIVTPIKELGERASELLSNRNRSKENNKKKSEENKIPVFKRLHKRNSTLQDLNNKELRHVSSLLRASKRL